jgi:organizing structure protein 2
LVLPTAAAVLVSTPFLLKPNIAYAETSPTPSDEAPRYSRKPIYDAPSYSPPSAANPAPSKPTPTDRLAEQIKKARLRTHRFVSTGEAHFNMTMARFFDLEESFTETVASLKPPVTSGERLLPNGIYVLVSTMTGSILVRNRGIFLRATVPAVIGVGAAWTFLPYTMTNVSELIWGWEKKVPAIAETHLRIRQGVEDAVKSVKGGIKEGKKWTDETVGGVRDKLEGLVKDGK